MSTLFPGLVTPFRKTIRPFSIDTGSPSSCFRLIISKALLFHNLIVNIRVIAYWTRIFRSGFFCSPVKRASRSKQARDPLQGALAQIEVAGEPPTTASDGNLVGGEVKL